MLAGISQFKDLLFIFTDFASSHWPGLSAVRIEAIFNRMQLTLLSPNRFAVFAEPMDKRV